jgi:histidine ammonia-lyase
MTAAQGCDFHRPLTSSEPLERARAALRAEVPTLEDDRFMQPDLAAAIAMVSEERIVAAAGIELPGIIA